MKKYISLLMAAAAVISVLSCERDESVGGSVNATAQLDMTTFEWLSQQEYTKTIASLFEAAGLVSTINGKVTLISPNDWSYRRYIRRRNSLEVRGEELPPYTLDSLLKDQEELQKLKMYIFDGIFDVEELEKHPDGVELTALDGVQQVRLTLDETNTDPAAAYDGGGAAGYGYQYSNWMMTIPRMVHVQFKRGSNWETIAALKDGANQDLDETDQYYRMYISDVHTSTGVVHVLYVGDLTGNNLTYYHTLFFFGYRAYDNNRIDDLV